MALTRCPRCSEELSDKIAICPHCAYALPGPAAAPVSDKRSRAIVREAQKSEETPAPAASGPAPLEEDQPTGPSGIEARFQQIHAEEGAISAIKYWREVTGTSLKDAKTFYDQEKAAGRLAGTPQRSKRRGCVVGSVVGLLALAFAALVAMADFSCRYSRLSHHLRTRRLLHHHRWK
jgi:ribosomal protein L7/L12